MKIYISGPIDSHCVANETQEQKELRFLAAATFLKNTYDAEVVNPWDIAGALCCKRDEEGKPEPRICDFMREDIKALCDCDAVYFLKDWELSTGCRCEFDVAVALRLSLLYQKENEVKLGYKYLEIAAAEERKDNHSDTMKG